MIYSVSYLFVLDSPSPRLSLSPFKHSVYTIQRSRVVFKTFANHRSIDRPTIVVSTILLLLLVNGRNSRVSEEGSVQQRAKQTGENIHRAVPPSWERLYIYGGGGFHSLSSSLFSFFHDAQCRGISAIFSNEYHLVTRQTPRLVVAFLSKGVGTPS